MHGTGLKTEGIEHIMFMVNCFMFLKLVSDLHQGKIIACGIVC
jgi:hypothetical protein